MARCINVIILLVLPLAAPACTNEPDPSSTLLIIDHNCTDLTKIPDSWIDSVQANLRLHYAHTSHGGQLTVGLGLIEDSDAKYSYALNSSNLPDEAGALCIFDGQEDQTYITPDLYWQTKEGMDRTRNVLSHNPSINLSMWSWCTQLNGYSLAQTQEYIDSMIKLEAEFPNVTFIYMTCNAQAVGAEGYNRHQNNELIREHCKNNKKVLFDFADLDSWYYNGSSWEQATYDYEGHQVPCEHEEFNGDEAAHTTYSSCEQKGKALWWMLAVLGGWKGGSTSVDENPRPISESFFLTISSNINREISYSLPSDSKAELYIYNSNGQLVRSFEANPGTHTFRWDGKDYTGMDSPMGVYFCQLRTGGRDITKKLLVIQ